MKILVGRLESMESLKNTSVSVPQRCGLAYNNHVESLNWINNILDIIWGPWLCHMTMYGHTGLKFSVCKIYE